MVVTILVQATATLLQVGLTALLQPRNDLPVLTGIPGRLDRAQLNPIVATALFAPAVAILAHKGISTPATLLAAQIFLFARVLYVPAHAFGLFGVRTLIWTAGIAATAWLYLAGMGAAVL